MTEQPYHIKYRPQGLEDVYGHEQVIKSIKSLFEKNQVPHAFLFVGSSGCGKTTISRIIANMLDCKSDNIIERDSAIYNGVGDIRTLINDLKYASVAKNPIKFVILDEAHQFSQQAWNALLKIIEEPPKHVYFSFCTTEDKKVPETIKTRCHSYNLKNISLDIIKELIYNVNNIEELNLNKDILNLIAEESKGSPRKALVNLSICRNCKSVEEAGELLESAIENKTVYDLCRYLVGKEKNFLNLVKLLKDIKELNAESVRLQLAGYIRGCLFNSKNSRDVYYFSKLLQLFIEPIYNTDGINKIIASCIYVDEELKG